MFNLLFQGNDKIVDDISFYWLRKIYLLFRGKYSLTLVKAKNKLVETNNLLVNRYNFIS